MPTRSQVISAKIKQYDAQITGTQEAVIETAIWKLALCQLVDAAFSGGGGGGGSTSAQTISDGIDGSIDIDSITGYLATIAAKPNGIIQSDIVSAIQTAADIDTIITQLNLLSSIDTKVTNPNIRPLTSADTVSVVLPTGLALESKQDVSNISLTSIDAKLTALQNKITNPGSGYVGISTITRAANVSPYIANDVYGGAFELQNIGSYGGHVVINGVRIIFNLGTLPVGMAGAILFLYNIPPPSAIADNGVFNVPAGDRVGLLTPIGIPLGNSVLALGGGSVVLSIDNLSMHTKLANGSTSLWGYLVTQAAFTPANASETAAISVFSVGL